MTTCVAEGILRTKVAVKKIERSNAQFPQAQTRFFTRHD